MSVMHQAEVPLAQKASPAGAAGGRQLRMARILWLLFTLITLAGTLYTAPETYRDLQVVCEDPACEGQLTMLLPSGVSLLESGGLSTAAYALFMTALLLVGTIVCCAVAILIFMRSRDWNAFLVSLAILLIGGQAFYGGPIEYRWFFLTATYNYALFVTLVLAFYLFPNGRFVPRWSRWVAAALFVTEFFYSYFPDAPFSPHNFFPPLETVVWIGALLLIPVSQIYRYITVSTPTERQQTKWIVAGLSIAFGGLLVVVELNVILPPSLLPGARLVANGLLTVALLAIPVSFAIAILRYRLWDIDLIVRRTLIYGLLTTTLAIVYLGSVVLLQNALRLLSGQGSQVAIVLSTLAIAALFSPLRRRIQHFIDQRFYRKRYDAQRTLASFAQTTRDEVELEQLVSRLVGLVEETFQPSSVGLWLKEDRR